MFLETEDTTAIPPTLPKKGQFSSGDTVYSSDLTNDGASVAPSQLSNNTAKATDSDSHRIFTASGISIRKAAPPPIYKWETTTGSDMKDSRTHIFIDNNKFLPSNQNSIYIKDDPNDIEPQPFIDVQIILTKEELDTLAARRKKLLRTATANPMNTSSINASKLLQNNHVASMSMHANTPYVDSKRIQKELFIRR